MRAKLSTATLLVLSALSLAATKESSITEAMPPNSKESSITEAMPPNSKESSTKEATPASCSATKSDKIRLVNEKGNPVYSSGRVEMKVDGEWASVCTYNFFDNKAKMICDSLCDSGATPMAISGPAISGVSAPKGVMQCSSNDLSGCKMIASAKIPTFLQNICKTSAAYVRCTKEKPKPKDLKVDVTCKSGIATLQVQESSLEGVMKSTFKIKNVGKPGKDCFQNLTRFDKSVLFRFTFQHCGGSVTLNNDSTSYLNIVVVKSPVINGIILNADITFAVVCNVTTSKKMSVGNITGLGKVARIGSEDNPNVFMRMYTDEAMTTPLIPGTGVMVITSTRIYTKIKDESEDEREIMVLRSCWLTPVPNAKSKIKLDLVIDGCENPRFVKQMRYKSNKEQILVFQPVLFKGSKVFYLHCQANTCGPMEFTEKCTRMCTNPDAFKSRRKRSIFYRKRSAGFNTYLLQSGPFYSLN